MMPKGQRPGFAQGPGVDVEGKMSLVVVMSALGTPITLRQGARVIEDSRRLRTVHRVSFSKSESRPTDPWCCDPTISLDDRYIPSSRRGCRPDF
jgi:hypothetical protein